MTDSDRKAFEDHALSQGLKVTRHPTLGYYKSVPTQCHEATWQAARDHYALNLAEDVAVEIIRQTAMSADINSPRTMTMANARFIMKALRAAGVKFRDEA